MSSKKRSDRESAFRFLYTLRGFAAMETLGDASDSDDKPMDSWSQKYLGQIYTSQLDDVMPKGVEKRYRGSISTTLQELKRGSIIVGIDRRTRLQKHKSGPHGPLPDAIFEVSVSIKGLEGNVRRGLLVLLEEGRIHDWEQLAKKYIKIERLLERHRPELGRLSESFMHKSEKLSEAFEDIFNSVDIDLDIKDIDWQKFIDESLSKLRNIEIPDERAERQLRSFAAQYLEVYKDLIKHDPKGIRLKKLDVSAVEAFGTDLFLLFRFHMNKFLRLLRYSRQQYWIEEIPEYESGYFYIDNEVSFDGNGPLIPIIRHHHAIDRIPEDFVIDLSEWADIREILSDDYKLSEHVDSFTLGGIFSQAVMAIEDEHVETAVILGLVGLEAAMSDVLEYFYGESGTLGTAGEKCRIIKCLLKAGNLHGVTNKEWRAIEGEPKPGFQKGDYRNYHDGLIPVRNGVQHRGERIPSDQMSRVVDFVATARRVSYRLGMWLETKPEMAIGRRCQKNIRWTRRMKQKA